MHAPAGRGAVTVAALRPQVEKASSIPATFIRTTGPTPDPLQTATSTLEHVVGPVGKEVATPPSPPSSAVELTPRPRMGMTPTRRTSRHTVADDGSVDTD